MNKANKPTKQYFPNLTVTRTPDLITITGENFSTVKFNPRTCTLIQRVHPAKQGQVMNCFLSYGECSDNELKELALKQQSRRAAS